MYLCKNRNAMTKKKRVEDLRITAVKHLTAKHVLLHLQSAEELPEIHPGQFVEVRVDHSPTVFLRRPISINSVDSARREFTLLVAAIGDGTRQLYQLHEGDTLNCVYPLGNGFTLPSAPAASKPLLVGGGVGVAPMMCLGQALKAQGVTPSFLLGARTKDDLLLLDDFRALGNVYLTTEDGSEGDRGFVTNHHVLEQQQFTMIYSCGPKPMMKAVATYARRHGIPCEVSLENMMACGLGACLCCVEPTVDGNLCVCKDGPVFNILKLKW